MVQINQGPNMLHMFLSLSVVLLYVVCTNEPCHSATESQSLRFSVKIFIKSALAWGPEQILSLGPKFTLGGPAYIKNVCHSFRKERNK